MKKLYFILFLLINMTLANGYELLENSPYRYKTGVIYAIKDDYENRISVLYSDSPNTVQILYYNLYSGTNGYYNLEINLNNVVKREFNNNSELQILQSRLLDEIDSLKKCPNTICRTTNETLENHFRESFLKLSADDALKTYVSDNKTKSFIKSVRKSVKSNLKSYIPKHSYKIVLVFRVNTDNGNVENFKIINSKVLTKSEEKVYRKAVSKSAPFRVPKEISNIYSVIPVKIPFNWNVRNFY